MYLCISTITFKRDHPLLCDKRIYKMLETLMKQFFENIYHGTNPALEFKY